MDFSRSSKDDFNKAADHENYLRWYFSALLPSEVQQRLDHLSEKRDIDLENQRKLNAQNKAEDIEKEFHRLISKERPELHYQPVYGRGGMIPESDFKRMAEHNVIVHQQRELEKIQNAYIHKFDSILASQGLYVRQEGNTKENLPKHFNERGGYNRDGQNRNSGRER